MSLDEALTTQTEQEAREELASDLAARGVDDKGFPDTSTQRRLLDSAAASQARASKLRAQLTMAGSRALVEQIPDADGRDAWAEYLSLGFYGLPRDPATRAQHRFVLTNAATGVQREIAPRQLRARAGKVEFINLEGGTLLIGGTLPLTWEAQTAGVVGNVPPGTVRQLVTALAGVTIDNPAISGQGSSITKAARDAERNASLLARGDARWGATSAGGSPGSYIEWIDQAFKYAGVEKTVTKWLVDDENPNGPGSTDVYLANDAGGATADEIAIVSAYYAIRRGTGTGPLRVLSATPRVLTYTATLYSTSGNAVADAIAADAELTADLDIGAVVYRHEIVERLMSIPGMKNVTLDFEDTDLVINEVALISGTHTVG
jgi:uncharacterized phage protein gp47/JayE